MVNIQIIFYFRIGFENSRKIIKLGNVILQSIYTLANKSYAFSRPLNAVALNQISLTTLKGSSSSSLLPKISLSSLEQMSARWPKAFVAGGVSGDLILSERSNSIQKR